MILDSQIYKNILAVQHGRHITNQTDTNYARQGLLSHEFNLLDQSYAVGDQSAAQILFIMFRWSDHNTAIIKAAVGIIQLVTMRHLPSGSIYTSVNISEL
ncbi:Hypothetical_protein [Hexamita inflata]|uniref:Hypothetical_protein n=1 Tax=Hexamita inflata TaxID=28002 RepID=A0AA86UKP2_9EUKA|nr:Hypothetical protein HINF_LOCUS42632 [Hexamita inflata]